MPHTYTHTHTAPVPHLRHAPQRQRGTQQHVLLHPAGIQQCVGRGANGQQRHATHDLQDGVAPQVAGQPGGCAVMSAAIEHESS